MNTFKSNDIYVFPCARPGGSSLASEYNFTHLSGRVSNKASYVIGAVNNILQVVLDGYYFEIKNIDSESLRENKKQLILWLETLSDSDSTNGWSQGWSHVTRRVCGAKYDSSKNEWKKLQDLDNLDEEGIRQFSALYVVDNTSNFINIEPGLTYVQLDLGEPTNWMENINFKVPVMLPSTSTSLPRSSPSRIALINTVGVNERVQLSRFWNSNVKSPE